MDPREALSPKEAFAGRFGALFLDLLLAVLLMVAIGGSGGLLALLALALVVLPLVDGITGHGLGKLVMGVRLVRAGSTAAPGPVAGVVRGLLRVPDLIVGLFLAGGDPQRRRLGDRVVGTTVIGLPAARRVRAAAGAGYVIAAIGAIAVHSDRTALVLVAIFGPFVLSFAVLLDAAGRFRIARWWAVAAGFALLPALYMVAVGACSRLGKNCPDASVTSNYHRGWIAVALVALAWISLRVAPERRHTVFPVLAGAAAVVEAWLLHVDHQNFGALLEALVVGLGILAAVLRSLRRDEEAQLSPPAGPPAQGEPGAAVPAA